MRCGGAGDHTHAPSAFTPSRPAVAGPSFSDGRSLDRVAGEQEGVSRQRFVVGGDGGIEHREQVASRGPARRVPLDGSGQQQARSGIGVVAGEHDHAANERIVEGVARSSVDGGDATHGRTVMRQSGLERVDAGHCSCAGGSAGALALDSHSRNCSR